MPKRRPELPTIGEQPAQKRLSRSLSTLAAKASSEALRYQPSGSFLNVFMPSSRHSSPRRSITPSPLPKATPSRPDPLTPGLSLSNRLLSTHPSSDVANVKEVLLFPTSLAVLNASWICRFSINTTPQLGTPLPSHIEEFLFQKYVSGIPLPTEQQEKVPYIHLGCTALAFQLHFYLILPKGNVCPTRPIGGTGHMPYRDLQLIYDNCIRPALDEAYPKRNGWATWIEAKNESHLKPLKSRRQQVGSCEPLQERLHCEGLGMLWNAIKDCEDESVTGLMEGAVLVAFGDVKKHDWPGGWVPSWSLFRQAWDEAINVEYLGGYEKIVVEMELGL